VPWEGVWHEGRWELPLWPHALSGGDQSCERRDLSLYGLPNFIGLCLPHRSSRQRGYVCIALRRAQNVFESSREWEWAWAGILRRLWHAHLLCASWQRREGP